MSSKFNIIRELLSISNRLDIAGLYSLSDRIDLIVKNAMPLSEKEVEQLGTEHPSSSFDYIDKDRWDLLRDKLVNKKPSRSYIETDEFKYDPELTAYTPGETLALLDNPKIKEWFNKVESFLIPEEFKHIIFVPCAASKPWGINCPSQGKYYKAYHDIKDQLKERGELAYWVTISEPLGIVPEDMWDNFLGYDVPGLFKDPSSRMSGMTTKDWINTFGEKFSPPFDKEAYDLAIQRLGRVIANFVKNNQMPGRKWISFVGGTKGKITTHTEMISEAKEFLKIDNITWDHSEYTKDKNELGHPTRSRVREHISDTLQKEIFSTREDLVTDTGDDMDLGG
jgi:hypothetical protein